MTEINIGEANISKINMRVHTETLSPESGFSFLSIDDNGINVKMDDSRVFPQYEDYILLKDVKTQGTHGGDFISGDWRLRDINTKSVDTGNLCSISSNTITLQKGVYRFSISCPATLVVNHIAKLLNISTSEEFIGTSEQANARSFIKGEFSVLSTSNNFSIYHKCYSTYLINGMGNASELAQETYTVAEFWRVG